MTDVEESWSLAADSDSMSSSFVPSALSSHAGPAQAGTPGCGAGGGRREGSEDWSPGRTEEAAPDPPPCQGRNYLCSYFDHLYLLAVYET